MFYLIIKIKSTTEKGDKNCACLKNISQIDC